MVWSVARSFTTSSDNDAVRDLIDNTISGLPNWTVATPSASSSNRNMQYNMGTKNIFDRTTQELFYSNSYHKINGPYNSNVASTWQEHNYTGSGGLTLGTYSSTGTYKTWTSSLLADSFFLTAPDGRCVWFWHECDTWLIQGPDGWDDSAAGAMKHTTYLGGSGAGHHRIAGIPGANAFNFTTPNSAGYSMDTQPNMSYYDSNISGKVLKGVTLMINSSTGSTDFHGTGIGVLNSDDILLQLGTSSGLAWSNASLSKVTDGTNWYFRTTHILADSALLLPVGTTEPVF